MYLVDPCLLSVSTDGESPTKNGWPLVALAESIPLIPRRSGCGSLILLLPANTNGSRHVTHFERSTSPIYYTIYRLPSIDRCRVSHLVQRNGPEFSEIGYHGCLLGAVHDLFPV